MTDVPRRALRAAAAGLAVAGLVAGGVLGVAAPSTAEPTTPPATAAELADVTARAERLQAEVDRLALVVEQAAEEHAGAQEQLAVLVSQEITADGALAAAQQRRSESAAVAGRRARALYMTGGTTTLVQTVLTTDASDRSGRDGLADLATDLRAVRTLVADDAEQVQDAQSLVDDAVAASRTVQGVRADRQAVEAEVARAATGAETALAQQRQLLQQTDAEVVELADRLRAEREAAALAAAEEAAAALAAQAAPALVGTTSTTGTTGTVAAPTAAAAAAIAAAGTRLGLPYQWGATGPSTFDCSGLTSWAYRQAGISIPRTSRAQYAALPRVPLTDLQPGDLVFYGSGPAGAGGLADPSTIHHVVIYLGGGRVLHAPRTGDVVKVSALSTATVVGAVRPTG